MNFSMNNSLRPRGRSACLLVCLILFMFGAGTKMSGQTDGFLTAFTAGPPPVNLCDMGCATPFGPLLTHRVHVPAFGTFSVLYRTRVCVSGPDTYYDISLELIRALIPSGSDSFEGYSFACIVDEIGKKMLLDDVHELTAVNFCEVRFRVIYQSCWIRLMGGGRCFKTYAPEIFSTTCCVDEYCLAFSPGTTSLIALQQSQGSGDCDVPEGTVDPQIYENVHESACGDCVD